MNGPLDADLAEFVAQLRLRLDAGAKQYGNSSFRRPLVELLNEVEQELLDTCGWSFLIWIRLQRVRHRIEAIGKEEGASG